MFPTPLGETLLVWGVFLIPLVKNTGYIIFGSNLEPGSLLERIIIEKTKWEIIQVKEGKMAGFRDRRDAGKILKKRLVNCYMGRSEFWIWKRQYE